VRPARGQLGPADSSGSSVTRENLGWSALIGMGTVFAVVLVGGLAIGWWLDGLLHTSPALLLVGLALGTASGVGYTVVQFRTYLQK
jgi:hypothetical protein